MHLRGLGNLCSRAVYNQGQVTLNFNTISCGLQSSGSGRHIIDYQKKQTRTLRISENKLYERWRHEIRHRGPPVKISRAPLPFNPALFGPPISGCCSSRTSRSRWLAHSRQRQPRCCNTVCPPLISINHLPSIYIFHRVSITRLSLQKCKTTPNACSWTKLPKVLNFLPVFLLCYKKTYNLDITAHQAFSAFRVVTIRILVPVFEGRFLLV